MAQKSVDSVMKTVFFFWSFVLISTLLFNVISTKEKKILLLCMFEKNIGRTNVDCFVKKLYPPNHNILSSSPQNYL